MKRIELIKKIMANMEHKAQGAIKGATMLSGNPGTGKTSAIRQISKILGIDLIVLEVPHITEEHVINIPFVHIHQDGSKTHGETVMKSPYELVLSKSDLFSQIEGTKAISDKQYLANVYADKNAAKIYEQLGGTKDKIPTRIVDLRAQFTCILFLDEFLRTTTQTIRNVLRGILNNHIADHDIPESCFIVYATNMNDDGLDEIPGNYQFSEVEVDDPSNEEWFAWFEDRYQDKIKIHEDVIDKFQKALEQGHLSHDDMESQVRTSPRRWEQILLYINASIPPSSQKEASALVDNVSSMFRNYESGKHSKLYEVVQKAVAELITSTSKFQPLGAGSKDWRNSLEDQIVKAMKIGKDRTYVPVISGLPGLGKTAGVDAAAREHNLRLIDIETSRLAADDIIGMPLPGKMQGGSMSVNFSEPPLLRIIEKKIKQLDAAYIATLSDAEKKQYEKQEFKYLIFFDELNTVNEKTFNALRRVLLEKDFGHGYALPKGSIIVGAINPHNGSYVHSFTSHMKDILDVVDATPHWDRTLQYLAKVKPIKGATDKMQAAGISIIRAFGKRFAAPNTKGIDQEFTPGLGGEVYISPREYTDILTKLVQGMIDARQIDNIEVQELRKICWSHFKETLSFILTKHGVAKKANLEVVEEWFMTTDDFQIGEGVVFYKAETKSAHESFSSYFQDPRGLVNSDDVLNFVKNNNLADFSQHLSGFLLSQVNSLEELEMALDTKRAKNVIVQGNKMVYGTEDACMLANFLNGVIHALFLHGFEYDRLRACREAAAKGGTSLINKYVGGGSKDERSRSINQQYIKAVMTPMNNVITSYKNKPAP